MPTYKFKTTFSRHENKRCKTIALHYPIEARGARAKRERAPPERELNSSVFRVRSLLFRAGSAGPEKETKTRPIVAARSEKLRSDCIIC